MVARGFLGREYVVKLIIGAGTRHKDGWVHHDIQTLPGIDIICDFWDLPKNVSEPCSNIEITHVLEHFPMSRTSDTFKLLYDLLAPGGELYIEVPNFKWHAQMILENPRDRKIVEYAYGGQLNEWDYHYMGFTPEILTEELVRAGLQVVELSPNSSIECRAVKRG